MAPISIRGVKKSYGKTQVVHGVDLDIASGEFVVILGPSGCGKSTLLRMIAGLEAISGGTIAIEGAVVNRREPRERGCAMVFQNYALYPHMTVAENIGYSLKVAGIAKADRQARIEAVARMLQLEALLDRKPAALSGGQRQRVAMGRAMIREPKVFLFDEPLSNLDAKLRVQMRAEIRGLHRRLGATSVFVTHDQIEAMTLADRMVVMNAGRIEQVGRPAEIYGQPASRFVATFVGSPSMNMIDGIYQHGTVALFNGAVRIAVSADASDGDAIGVGLRPEALQVVPPSTHGALVAKVDFIEELGAGRAIYADINGTPIAVVSTEPVHPEPGAEIGLLFDAADAHLFDAASGLRLEAQAMPLLAVAE
jgi:sn-glycerol 3-phosphate transport system ATP-binding protein